MIPFRISLNIQVSKGNRIVWRSPRFSMFTLNGKLNEAHAIGAAFNLLGLISDLRKLHANALAKEATPQKKRRTRKK